MNDGAHYCDKVCLESGHTKPMFKGPEVIRCPECGNVVKDFFDHVDGSCPKESPTGRTPSEPEVQRVTSRPRPKPALAFEANYEAIEKRVMEQYDKGRIDIRNSQTDLTSQKGSGTLPNMKTFYTISTKSTGSAFADFPDFRPGTRLAGADDYEDAIAIKKLLEQRYPGKQLVLDRVQIQSKKSREREFFVNTTSDRGSESEFIKAFDEDSAIEIAKNKVYAHKVKWYTVCVYLNAEQFHRGRAPLASKGFIGTRVDAADSARGSRYGA